MELRVQILPGLEVWRRYKGLRGIIAMLEILQDNNNVGNIDDKSGSLMANTRDLAYMGEPLLLLQQAPS